MSFKYLFIATRGTICTVFFLCPLVTPVHMSWITTEFFRLHKTALRLQLIPWLQIYNAFRRISAATSPSPVCCRQKNTELAGNPRSSPVTENVQRVKKNRVHFETHLCDCWRNVGQTHIFPIFTQLLLSQRLSPGKKTLLIQKNVASDLDAYTADGSHYWHRTTFSKFAPSLVSRRRRNQPSSVCSQEVTDWSSSTSVTNLFPARAS